VPVERTINILIGGWAPDKDVSSGMHDK